MRGDFVFVSSFWAATLCAAAVAHAQVEAPPGSVLYDDSGSVEAIQDSLIKLKDSKSETWVLEVSPQTKVSIKGDAELDYLRPGLNVEFTAEIDKKGALKNEIEKIQIFSSQGRVAFGFFPSDNTAADLKPLQKPGAGSYRIKGKLASYRDGSFTVAVGLRKISGKLGEDPEVTVSLDDLGLAQAGDEIKVKGWYYEMQKANPVLQRPGKAWAQEITVTLAKPLAPTGKRLKPVDKPRGSAKSSKASSSKTSK